MVKKLSYSEFLKSLELAPRIVVELLIENKQKEPLLIKRIDKPYIGYWHLPGGFLLKNESIQNCIKRLAKEEVGLNYHSTDYKMLGLFENIKGDSRGHILHYVVKLKSNKQPQGRFFEKLPKKTISYQKRFLRELGYKE